MLSLVEEDKQIELWSNAKDELNRTFSLTALTCCNFDNKNMTLGFDCIYHLVKNSRGKIEFRASFQTSFCLY